MDTQKPALMVAALENGTVIDHIPSNKVFDVVNLLGLSKMDSPITIGANLTSHKMSTKGIIKIADRFLTEDECRKLSVIAPNIVMSTIRNYKVADKMTIQLPDVIRGTVRCQNPKCITNHEPMDTVFDVIDKQNGVLRCRYCNKDVNKSDIKLI